MRKKNKAPRKTSGEVGEEEKLAVGGRKRTSEARREITRTKKCPEKLEEDIQSLEDKARRVGEND